MEAFQFLNILEEAHHEQNELRQRMRQRRRAIRAITRPFDDMTETDFVKLYRLPQRIVRNLVEDIRGDMPQTQRSSAVSVESKVLAALSFYATGSYQRVVGQDFCHTMSQSMISRSVEEVSRAINNRLLHTWIKFPMTHGERTIVKERFYEATGIPGTIGAIDCTHVAVVRPTVHEEQYVNRKSYHSLNVQAVCDYDMRFLSLNARFPGSTGDAFIWRNSLVKNELSRRYNAGERGEWLIGDSGYGNEPWLLLPILHAEPGTPEENFTTIHCRSRCCIERAFGVMKARWRCLLKHRVLHYNPQKAAIIVNVCAILHNIAIDARLPEPEPLNEQEAAAEMEMEAGDWEVNPINIGLMA